MPWGGLDDGFHEDPRALEAGLAATGLYARATCYSARHLLDGVIPRVALARLLDGGDMAPVDALLRVGLLEEDGDAYIVVDYLKANKTREDIEKKRADDKARKAKGRRKWEARRRAEAQDEDA